MTTATPRYRMGRRGMLPHDDRALAMWAAYQAGQSLREVAQLFSVTRSAVYGMFVRRGWKLRHPTPPKGPTPAV